MIEERTPEEMAALDRFAGITLTYLIEETQLGHLLQRSGDSSVTDSCMRSSAEKAYNMAKAMLDARRRHRTWKKA